MEKQIKLKYLYSATRLKDLPKSNIPEYALVGRSNVGKSSLINYLAGQKRLAFVSHTPGRTQAINIFSEIHEKFFIADLPGYGFAKSSKQIQEHWEQNIRDYFEKRSNLEAIFFLIDVRRDVTAEDINLIEWFKAIKLPVFVIQTKCDKVSRSQLNLLKSNLAKTFSIEEKKITSISVLKKIGLDDLLNLF